MKTIDTNRRNFIKMAGGSLIAAAAGSSSALTTMQAHAARTRDRAASTSSSRPAMKVIQKEPLDMLDPETRGLFASIGIEKGKPFRPDERMKKILTDAVAIDFTANSQQKVAVGAHD